MSNDLRHSSGPRTLDKIDIAVSNASGARAPTKPTMTPAEAAAAEFMAQQRVPKAQYTPGLYGDLQFIPLTMVANIDTLILPRPKTTRVMLVIQNNIAGAVIYLNFDQPAAIANGLQLAPGGNIVLDSAVPQNDVHCFTGTGGLIMVGYINLDITRPL